MCLLRSLMHCSAKYPLAMIAQIIETHQPGTLGGYDIGCSFEGTVKNSSLGGLYEAKNAHLCVNAFHGYSHSHMCQMKYHPNIIKGIGLEDLETMEQVFSSSNQLASVIWYASRYRRRLFIEAYFKQWDIDKYQNLGTFLFRNFTQALEITLRDKEALESSMQSLGITDADMDAWEKEEAQFFSQLGTEREYDLRAVTYVELLQRYQELGTQRAQSRSALWQIITPETAGALNRDERAKRTRQIEVRRSHVVNEHERLDMEIRELELIMDVDKRWTPATPQYQEAVKYLKERKYQRALEKLQQLVIYQLFELHKLNLARTG